MSIFSNTRRNVVYSALFVLTTVGLILVTGGNVGAALVPVVVTVLFFGLVCLPLRYTLTGFYAVMLLFHAYSDNPMSNLWEGPLSVFKRLLYANLRHHTGIGFLRFNALEAGLALLFITLGIRTLMRNNIDRQKEMPAARPMKIAAFVSLGGVFLTVAWGMARGGGQFDQLLFQIRSLFWLPLSLILAMRAFKTERDFRRLGVVLAVVCMLRILEGMYFYFFIAPGTGVDIDYVMTHDDTVWLVTLMVILISSFLETLSKRAFMRLIAIGGLTMYALFINQRRIAYVSLALSLITVAVFIRPRVRRWLLRAFLVTLPISALYIGIGMHSRAAIFSPVHNLMSVSDDTDDSNWTRNIENYNLIATLRTNPVLGTGWGHAYNEILYSYDISSAMPTYRHHPHNSMLGLLASTGVIGTFLIWIYLPIGVFLATRAYRAASTPTGRTTAMTAISIVIIYLVQAYGDMGRESGDIGAVLAAGLGSAANLVMRTNGLSTSPDAGDDDDSR